MLGRNVSKFVCSFLLCALAGSCYATKGTVKSNTVPLEGVTVTVKVADDSSAMQPKTVHTEANGVFRLALTPGAYIFSVKREGFFYCELRKTLPVDAVEKKPEWDIGELQLQPTNVNPPPNEDCSVPNPQPISGNSWVITIHSDGPEQRALTTELLPWGLTVVFIIIAIRYWVRTPKSLFDAKVESIKVEISRLTSIMPAKEECDNGGLTGPNNPPPPSTQPRALVPIKPQSKLPQPTPVSGTFDGTTSEQPLVPQSGVPQATPFGEESPYQVPANVPSGHRNALVAYQQARAEVDPELALGKFGQSFPYAFLSLLNKKDVQIDHSVIPEFTEHPRAMFMVVESDGKFLCFPSFKFDISQQIETYEVVFEIVGSESLQVSNPAVLSQGSESGKWTLSRRGRIEGRS